MNGRAAGTGGQRVDFFDERRHNEVVNQFVFNFGPLVSGGCEELLTVSVLEVEEFLGVELDATTGEFEGQLHHISHFVVLNQGEYLGRSYSIGDFLQGPRDGCFGVE